MKFKMLCVSIVCAMILCITYYISRGNESVEQSEVIEQFETVAYVNRMPIAAGELALYISRNKTDTYRDFYDRYQFEDDGNFWNNSYDGEIPSEVCKQKALEDLVSIKIEQAMLIENDIVHDVNYQSFYNRFIAENKRRLEAIKNNQPIYGVEQYQADQFYEYTHSLHIIELKKILSQKTEYTVNNDQSMPGNTEFEEQYAINLEALIEKANTVIVNDMYEKVLIESEF